MSNIFCAFLQVRSGASPIGGEQRDSFLSHSRRRAEILGIDGGIILATTSLQSISDEIRAYEGRQKLKETVQHQQWDNFSFRLDLQRTRSFKDLQGGEEGAQDQGWSCLPRYSYRPTASLSQDYIQRRPNWSHRDRQNHRLNQENILVTIPGKASGGHDSEL